MEIKQLKEEEKPGRPVEVEGEQDSALALSAETLMPPRELHIILPSLTIGYYIRLLKSFPIVA